MIKEETETPARYRVSAEYITIKVAGSIGSALAGARGGYSILSFYRGAVLPSSAHPDSVARLLRAGMIEPVEEG